MSTPGNGDLVDTVKALYGKNVSEELLTVDFADSEVKVRGFIGKPTLLKGTCQWQTLLVNGRIITNRMIAKAIDHAYQSQIPKSGFPFAVLIFVSVVFKAGNSVSGTLVSTAGVSTTIDGSVAATTASADLNTCS